MVFENYTIYRIGLWLIAHLPRGFVYFGAGVIAELNFFFNRTGRRGVYANQRRVLPSDLNAFDRWRAARAAFRHFSYSIVDFFHIPNLTQENLDSYIAEVRGLEHVRGLQAQNLGGVFMTVHMGSWELGGAAMSFYDVPITAAVLKHKDPRIDEIFNNTRLSGNIEIVHVGGALAKLENALTRGRFIALLADRDVKGAGLRLPFFGEPTRMPTGHAKLALRNGAAILPATTYRVHDFRIVIEIEEPLWADPAGETEESLTARCIEQIERMIQRRPDQWLSFFNLWSENLPTYEAHRDD